jgi:hypothetical protein
MNSTYELRELAKLTHKRKLERAQERRLAQSLKQNAGLTSDEYQQFIVRENRPCHC